MTIWPHAISRIFRMASLRWVVPIGVSLLTSAFSQTQAKRIRVRVIDDGKKGVPSQLFLIKPDVAGGEIFLSDAPSGSASVEHDCLTGERIKAKPNDSGVYYDSDRVACAASVSLLVTSRRVYGALVWALDDASAANDWGKAALISNELSVRASWFEPEKAEGYRKKTLEETAKKLNVGDWFTVHRGRRYVMSTKLATAVAERQKKAGIKPDGQLNYITLRSLAGSDIGTVIEAGAANGTREQPEMHIMVGPPPK